MYLLISCLICESICGINLGEFFHLSLNYSNIIQYIGKHGGTCTWEKKKLYLHVSYQFLSQIMYITASKLTKKYIY